MDYFTAVQEGKARSQRAVQLLQEVAGQSSSVFFMKTGRTDWVPVGDENLHSSVAGKNDTAALVICDNDGNTKAMSAWLPRARVEQMAAVFDSRGVERFHGEVKLPI